MSSANRQSIPDSYSKCIVVEGKDAFRFFIFSLTHLGLLSDIWVLNAGGTDQLPPFIKLLPVTPGFANVTSLGIIRDAESNMSNAFDSIRFALERAGLNTPAKTFVHSTGKPRTSIYILPDCNHPGMLETLCLQAVNGDPIIPCVEQYFQCIKSKNVDLPSNQDKSRFHTFLSSKREPGLLLGEAADRGYLPWDNPAFDSIKKFLRAL